MTVPPISLPALMPVVIAVLVGWRIYRRVRRLVGRQPVRVRRLVLTAVFFPILAGFVALSGLRDVALVEGLVAGAAIGIALGLVGLRLTRFEATGAGFFFVPNTAIGVAVSVLFIGRLVYRFGVLYFSTGHVDPGALQASGSSALTIAIFGIVAAYYTTSAVGILLWYRKARYDGAAPEATVETPLL